MVKKLYEVRNRSGDLILENATSGEIREELHCTTAQVNNARTSGDHIFGEYKVEEIDRKLSRKTDFDLLREFESVCDQLFFTFHDVSINTPSSIHPYNTDIILPLSVNLVTSLFLYLFLSFWTALIFEIFLISQALSTS